MFAARSVIAPFLLTRVLTAIVALASVMLLSSPTTCPDVCHPSTNPLLDAATRWDAKAYVDIAHDGYGAVPANNAYFPLYPFLLRALATLFGGSDDAYLVAGVVISNVALLVALMYLARLLAIDHDAAAGTRAAVYLLVFPTSVFLAVVYPESLLIALSIGAVYHARRGEWLLAVVLGALAALTRPFIGAAVALPLAIEAYRRSGLRAAVGAAAPAGIALVGWLVALWRITGDPKAILTAEANWGVGPSLPFEAFTDLFDPKVYGFPYFVLGFTLFIGALVVMSWRFLRPSLAAYATVVFLISVATGSLTSSPRYYLAVFPAFMVLALVARGWTGRAYVAVGAVISVIFTAMYALWYWVA
ncbi:MAG TPA: mannosyltransferase family protein [Candidatus Bathyarchaeia archaeon]|nr:mannosyltransferase family protein [Candidatus Bathyarchaeia archaeon]